jgi:hypothetical protein
MPLDMFVLTDVFIQYFMVPALGTYNDTLQPQISRTPRSRPGVNFRLPPFLADSGRPRASGVE